MADAPLRDVFYYSGNTASGPGFRTETGRGTSDIPSKTIQDLIDKGIITQTTRHYQNESGEGDITTNNVDFSRLPAFQPPTNLPAGYGWIPAYDKNDLVNPNLTYDDPNYGMMTVSGNLKSDRGDWQDMIGPLVMGAVTLGVGAPWFLSAGLNAAKTLGSYGLSKDTSASYGQATSSPAQSPTGQKTISSSDALNLLSSILKPQSNINQFLSDTVNKQGLSIAFGAPSPIPTFVNTL